jgi:hypothetical protein
MWNSGNGAAISCLGAFLGANRYPLRLKTLWLASRTKPDSGKRYMTGALTGDPYCGDGAAQAWLRSDGAPSLPRNQPEAAKFAAKKPQPASRSAEQVRKHWHNYQFCGYCV